jgi:hypothetical protein
MKPKFQYCVYKRPLSVSILSQLNAVHDPNPPFWRLPPPPKKGKILGEHITSTIYRIIRIPHISVFIRFWCCDLTVTHLHLFFLRDLQLFFWINLFEIDYLIYLQIPVTTGSKARVCCLPPAGVANLEPSGSTDVCLLQFLCVVRYRSSRRAYPPSGGVLPTVVCQCVWSRNIKNEAALDRIGLLRHGKKKLYSWSRILFENLIDS